MKKLYPLLSVLFLIYWGCEEEADESLPYLDLEWIQYSYPDSAVSSIDSLFAYTDSMLVDTNYYYYDVVWGDEYYVYTDSGYVYDTLYTDVLIPISYYLNSTSDTTITNTESYPCKWIHYFNDEKYFEYEITSETEKMSMDVSGFTNILYKEK